ncbi:aminotransferase class V-fold PLP-dependent enzyme [Pedobacter sp. SD-b]|uniref:Aminotransferase class V-fold PLP-dependent enzyme n=1 Tax=Pedobacter segetis TaxID=2793069 RepID=A0ABS1BGX1_9SPHI|nr:aminotransferase class I/II-fold pyridoxal phosphate-dependent enzyme [Pedobacter segetis]MBK0382077.1 aminotransferase class V-fold PLP-dependent enzyme [Pedobacter segetis]
MNTSLEHFLLPVNSTVQNALKVIDQNAQGICFIVDEFQRPVGILTDGDLRRAFLNGTKLQDGVEYIMNRNFTVLPFDTHTDIINGNLNQKIKHIPLVDQDGRLVDFANKFRTKRIPIMQPQLSGNELAYVSDCITSGWISSQGSYVKRFEEAFTKYCQMPYALAVSNGTTSLHLALVSLGIGAGDEVIIPDFTFAATINAILYTGAVPVIVDVDLTSWTIDPICIKKAITPKTKAIMPVHIYGHAADMDVIMEIANEHQLFVIEDSAEALGSTYHDQPIGSFGDVSSFSFFGNKTITTGEGGMLLFKDKAVYERAAILRDHGMSKNKRYWHDMIGFNYRMTNMQAAVGVAQMERVDDIVYHKRKIAQFYDQALRKYPSLQLHGEKDHTTNSYWLYTFLIKESSKFNREELAERLAKNGIETRPTFYPMHSMPIYAKYGRKEDLKNSIYISETGLSLPSYADITMEELENVTAAIATAFTTIAFNQIEN